MKLLRVLLLVFITPHLVAQNSMNMQLLAHWEGGGNVASSDWGNIYNEVWGYASDGREYAIIGTTEGTHFLDVTEPSLLYQVDFVPGHQQGPVVVHRDYHNQGSYLYMVCQEGDSRLKIADLSYLPDSVHVIYDSNEHLRGAHNIFIDTITARMYAVFVFRQGVSGFTGLQVYDIEDPFQPILLQNIFPNQDVHDLYVRNNIAFLNRGTSYGMQVYDFSTLPGTLLGSITSYPGQGYNHSGYLNPQGDTYVMADETHGSELKMLDVSDLSDINVLSTMGSGVNSLSIAHNQIWHNDKVFSAYYYDGVYIWSAENPSSPELLGFYDTCTLDHINSFQGAWGVYPFLPSGNILVSDMQTGLWVLKLEETNSIKEAIVDFISLGPNPVITDLKVRSNAPTTSRYEIHNLSGERQISGYIRPGFNILNTAHLESGMYLLCLITEEGNLVKKFIKE